MPDYRAYLVGSDGHFYRSVALDLPDEAAAIAAAKQLVDGHDVELGCLTARSPNSSRRKNNSEQIRCSFVLIGGAATVSDGSDRKELLRRLEQSRRLAAEPSDPLTKERVRALVADLEGQLE